MKGKLATYKYDGLSTPRFVFGAFFKGGPGVGSILIVLAVVLYFCAESSNPVPTFVFSLLVLAFISAMLFSSGPGIIISSKYFVFGKKTFMYENVASIFIDEKNLKFILKNNTGKTVHIVADNFNTNANKEWKIKNNKRKKFINVISKITDYALKENASLVIDVVNADHFKKYKFRVGS